MSSSASRPRLHLPKMGLAPQVVIFLLVIGLAGAMAIEPTRQLVEQRRRIEGMTAELREVQSNNDKLERRIGRLKDPDFVEQQARAQIGLVRPGETAVVVMPPAERQRRNQRKSQAAEVAPPPAPGFIGSLMRFIGL